MRAEQYLRKIKARKSLKVKRRRKMKNKQEQYWKEAEEKDPNEEDK